MIKRILMALAPMFVCASVFAQDNELLTLITGDDDMMVAIAGFDLRLGPSDRSHEERALYGSVNFFSPVNIGVLTMTGAEDIVPDIRIPRSWSLYDDLVSLGLHGRGHRGPVFNTGIRLSYLNYRLQDGYVMTVNEAGVPCIPGGDLYDKSKFKLTYLGVPVTLGMNIGKSFRLNATATFDMLVDARNKVKDPESWTRLDDLNPYRVSAELSLGSKGFGVFMNYGLTSIFKDGSGIDARSLSVGVRLF